MLSYTMSEDGYRASIGPCVGGFIRLSIIRICRAQGWEIPAEALDEETGLEDLKALHFEVQAIRAKLQRDRQQAARELRHLEQAEREQRLPAGVAAQVAELRRRSALIRAAAWRAERNADMRRELAEAERIEGDAKALIESTLQRGRRQLVT